ncbi:glycoside hydrolase family 65 [Listeria innocua]|uniref:glycoside hydrolase family 65 n=1 Tax=Listeria innocua TaxID=1642 RepID=UPI0016299AD1|nr:glycoside hydrolase family 65 [Listeria innocua]MBC1910472.1 glycoside hydrolase family 65 [Listeria innocua]MBC1928795.1 glycoside hydrolase family 65 [Listeria innocua]
MINRKKILQKFSPNLTAIDFKAPLNVGNGQIGFYCDVTGFQTLNEDYTKNHVPLCCMAQWGWHATPVSSQRVNYTLADLEMTDFDFKGRKVSYPVEAKKDNEAVYQWLRQNPHRLNLIQVSLLVNGKKPQVAELKAVNQTLHLETGIVESRYQIGDAHYYVETFSDDGTDTIGFQVHCSKTSQTEIELFFPYPSPEISAMAVTTSPDYRTDIQARTAEMTLFKCVLDATVYYVKVSGKDLSFRQSAAHTWCLSSQNDLAFNLSFSEIAPTLDNIQTSEIYQQSLEKWVNFWDTTGFIDFTGSTNALAPELQRRVCLSQYQLAVNCTGDLPPQETGLMCNSWYGKFHLEMHIWHAAYLPLWQKSDLLEKSLDWYLAHLKEARDNAQVNGYKGLRWPKMVSATALESPSLINPLIIWQQPHILYLLELVYSQTQERQLLEKYWQVVAGTAEFMIDFLQWNESKQQYDLLGPIVPSQEEFDPTSVVNPTFELEYWRFGLSLAVKWARRMGNLELMREWQAVHHQIAPSTVKDKRYLAHENCPTTFPEFMTDHPAMLGIYGLIPNDRVDVPAFSQTLDQVLADWDFDSMWGWDFGVNAMAATRLNKPDLAMAALLCDTTKNRYAANGHNYQEKRIDLPAYLPGNGSLLLAITLMVAGFPEASELPGIPKDGTWQVAFENISPFPY